MKAAVKVTRTDADARKAEADKTSRLRALRLAKEEAAKETQASGQKTRES
jgi:hypothetical protein